MHIARLGQRMMHIRPWAGRRAVVRPSPLPPTHNPALPRWWSFEALILMSGWLPDATLAVATMGVCNLTNSVS